MSKYPALIGTRAVVACAAATAWPQQPRLLAPTLPVPLFFREPWRRTGAFEAPEYRPQHPVTQADVTSPRLRLAVHDPGAAACSCPAAAMDGEAS